MLAVCLGGKLLCLSVPLSLPLYKEVKPYPAPPGLAVRIESGEGPRAVTQ